MNDAVKRSNSYNLVPVRDFSWPAGSSCPLVQEHPGFDRARSVFLRLKDRLRLFVTQTGDFSSEELLAIKDEYGQLYVDLTRKLAPDDFAKDLAKLSELPECGACVCHANCGGAWRPERANCFLLDEQRLLDLLQKFRGNVLDIGCGDGPYLRCFEEPARAGLVRYLGVDVDAQRLKLLAARYPWAHFHKIKEGEPLKLQGEFQHVLILRSFNHLEHPRRVVVEALAQLKVGGTLTVVDNVAFGLVRQAEVAQRAEQGPAEHEHYRNADSHEALKLLAGLPLKLALHQAVTPKTSNQWLIHMNLLSRIFPAAEASDDC